MQDYFTKNAFSEKADRIGAHLGIWAVSTLFFLLLWNFRLPAFIAGAALYGFIITLRRTGRTQRLKQKENNLRSRIGGELALERLLLQSADSANLEAAKLLCQTLRMTLSAQVKEGILCICQNELILTAYVQQHPADSLTASKIAAFQRACIRHHATHGYLCTPGKLSAEAREQASFHPSITLLEKPALIALWGKAFPATDKQLVQLKHRKQKRMGGSRWWTHLTERHLAPRYARYAALMIILFFLTRLTGYALSAIGMMILCTLCRCRGMQKAPPLRERS